MSCILFEIEIKLGVHCPKSIRRPLQQNSCRLGPLKLRVSPHSAWKLKRGFFSLVKCTNSRSHPGHAAEDTGDHVLNYVGEHKPQCCTRQSGLLNIVDRVCGITLHGREAIEGAAPH